MRKSYLFMAAAALSCMASFNSMASDAVGTPAAATAVEASTETTAEADEGMEEALPDVGTGPETAAEGTSDNKNIPTEDAIRNYEKKLKESEQGPAVDAEETGSINTETETEGDYIEVPSEDVTEAMQEIYSFLRYNMGFNHAAACGIIANMKYESDYAPTAVGDGGSSYGLCQWHNARYSALLSYCGANGLDGNSISGQMAFLSNELSSKYPGVMEHLYSVPNNAQGAYDSAYYWCKYYEVPANTEARAVERASYAQNTLYGKSFTYKKTARRAVADIRHEILENSIIGADEEEVYGTIIDMVRPEQSAG